jgi:DNA-binding NarL/FixJ family response regulator
VKVLEIAGFQVAAEVGDADAALAAIEEHRPELGVLDVRMPPGFTDEGVRAALVIRRQFPGTSVLLLSQYVEERYATDLLSANTDGVGYPSSNSGSPMSMRSSTCCAESQTAGQRWTRRSSHNCSCAVTATRSSGSPRASGTFRPMPGL